MNPRTGLPAQSAQQFADKQIYAKTVSRIEAVQTVKATRSVNRANDAPALNDIQNIKHFVFRLDGDSPELRQAVINSINQLRTKYPSYTFEATFGGKK